jgi:membrane protein
VAVPPAAAKPPVESRVRQADGNLAMALLRRFIDTDLVAQSAALAFYAVLWMAPLLLLLLWFTQTLLPSGQEALLDQIRVLAGGDARRLAEQLLAAADRQPDPESVAGWWSIALLFLGAAAVFAQLQDALNRIFRTEAAQLPSLRAWLRKRVFSLGLVLAVGFLLAISLTITTAVQFAFARVDWMLPVMVALAGWVVYALAFALMYRYLPDRRVEWRMAVLGGALTALLFALGRFVIGWYLEQANPASAFGSMATLALAMLWIYYAGLVIFVGALLTAVLDERRSSSAARRKRG